MKYLVLIADIDEFIPFKESLSKYITEEYEFHGMKALKFSYKSFEVTAVCFGIGKVNAATGAALALCAESYDGVINTGWSGAVSGVFKGEVIVSDSCVECDFDITVIGKKLGEKPNQDTYVYKCDSALYKATKSVKGFSHGNLGTGDFFLTDKAIKEKYKEIFNINSFDMESGAVASVCHLLRVPFVSIRKISDSADDTALSEYTESLKTDNTAFSDIVLSVLDALYEA